MKNRLHSKWDTQRLSHSLVRNFTKKTLNDEKREKEEHHLKSKGGIKRIKLVSNKKVKFKVKEPDDII